MYWMISLRAAPQDYSAIAGRPAAIGSRVIPAGFLAAAAQSSEITMDWRSFTVGLVFGNWRRGVLIIEMRQSVERDCRILLTARRALPQIQSALALRYALLE